MNDRAARPLRTADQHLHHRTYLHVHTSARALLKMPVPKPPKRRESVADAFAAWAAEVGVR